eukprot:403374600
MNQLINTEENVNIDFLAYKRALNSDKCSANLNLRGNKQSHTIKLQSKAKCSKELSMFDEFDELQIRDCESSQYDVLEQEIFKQKQENQNDLSSNMHDQCYNDDQVSHNYTVRLNIYELEGFLSVMEESYTSENSLYQQSSDFDNFGLFQKEAKKSNSQFNFEQKDQGNQQTNLALPKVQMFQQL